VIYMDEDKEIEVVDIYCKDIDGSLTTFIYTSKDGLYEAITIIDPKTNEAVSTLGDEKEGKDNLLLRHTSALRISIGIQKNKMKFNLNKTS